MQACYGRHSRRVTAGTLGAHLRQVVHDGVDGEEGGPEDVGLLRQVQLESRALKPRIAEILDCRRLL